ncbi:unnamed protein product, partial [marine sediment metagenome]
SFLEEANELNQKHYERRYNEYFGKHATGGHYTPNKEYIWWSEPLHPKETEHNGVMGMNFAPAFVAKDNPTVEDLVDHIDHIVNLVGPDYVGIGADFDGITKTPKGLEDVSKIPNITRVLVKREYSDEDITKILGGNYLRVFKKVLK